MRPLTSLPAVAAVVLLATGSASALSNDVLFRSGVVAPDGRAISYFSTPRASRPSRGIFGGRTSAILTKSGSTFAVVAKTGDPLPIPLDGTFNAMSEPDINNSGAVAFRADLNSTSTGSGIFMYDGTTLTPIALSGGTAGGARVDRPEINNANEVLYRVVRTSLVLWSGGVSTPIASAGDAAPGGGTFSRFDFYGLSRSIFDDTAIVAFAARVSGGPNGVFTWDPTNGIRSIARHNTTAPGFPGGTFNMSSVDSVSINALGHVAFTSRVSSPQGSTTAIFLYNPADTTVSRIAANGDAVGSDNIQAISALMGVNDSTSVAFYSLMQHGLSTVVQWSGGPLTSLTGPIGNVGDLGIRLTNPDHVIWTQGDVKRFDGTVTTVMAKTDTTPLGVGVNGSEPSLNDSDVAVFAADQTVLYGYDSGALTPLLAVGDPTPGGTNMVFSFNAPVLRSSSLAVNIIDTDFGQVLALKRGKGPFTAAVRSTDVTPVGGTFDLDENIFDVNGRTLVFASTITGGDNYVGLFRAKTSTGVVTALALGNNAAPGGGTFRGFDAVAAAGKEAVFIAALDGGSSGVFVTKRDTISAIARDGDPVPGTAGAMFSSFSSVLAHGSNISFVADTSAGHGVFTFRRGVLAKVALEGESAPGGGMFVTIDDSLAPPALGTKGPAFVAEVDNGSGITEGLYAANRAVLSRRELLGDPVNGGGTVIEMENFEPLSCVGRAIVYEAGLDPPSGAVWGLLANRP